MKNKIIERIIDQYNISGFDKLTEEIPLSDLQSLLIELYSERAETISPKQLLEQYKKNRFVKPSKLNPKDILDFDLLAYKLLPKGYQALQLAPVAPLGAASVIAPISQNTVLTTIRNTEVCSDVTNVLALEAALIRKKLLKQKAGKMQWVRLCASHRLLRTQLYDSFLSIPHFQIFSLCIAGRDEGSFKFETKAVCELIEYYSNLINQYIHNRTQQKQKIIIKLFTHNPILANVLEENVKKIDAGIANIMVENDPKENWNYYSQLRFKIFLPDNSGKEEFHFCDGGDTTWTQRLLSDKKERYIISGLGSESLIIQKIM